jgi:hypothetical protein
VSLAAVTGDFADTTLRATPTLGANKAGSKTKVWPVSIVPVSAISIILKLVSRYSTFEDLGGSAVRIACA